MERKLLEGLLSVATNATLAQDDPVLVIANEAMSTIRDLEKKLKDEKEKTEELKGKLIRKSVREYNEQ